MANKPIVPKNNKKSADVSHPGMMGDGTEEQNLNERGNPSVRIKKDEVDAAFNKQRPKKIALLLIKGWALKVSENDCGID